MSLEHSAVPESKEVLKNPKDEGMSERHRADVQSWNKFSKKIV